MSDQGTYFVQHDPDSGLRITGLAPMAVLPGWQNQGIGSMLVQKGLEACRRKINLKLW